MVSRGEDAGPDGAAAAPRPARTLLPALGFAALTFLLRIPFLRFPFAPQDESYYAGVAQATFEGRAIYADLGFIRPPALSFVYAVALKIAEATGLPFDLTVRLMAALFAAATVGVVAWLLFRFLKPLPAAAGSLLAALLSASLILENEANSETWLMLPYVASAALVIWAVRTSADARRWRLSMVVAGALTAVAALFKEVALVNLAVPLLATLALAEGKRFGRAVTAALWFAGGVLGVVACVLLGLETSGQAADFLYHTWYTRLNYVADTYALADPFAVLGAHLLPIVKAFVVPLAAASTAAVAALMAGARERSAERRLVVFSFGWLVVSAVGVAAGGRFYPHYFIQVTIPLVMLLASSLAALGGPPRRLVRGGLAVALVLVACAYPAWSWAEDVARAPAVQKTRTAWRDLAGRADAATPPGGAMFVWGAYPIVRAYSHSAQVTDEVWTYYSFGPPGSVRLLGESFPSVGDRILADLEARPPDTVVLTAELGGYLPGSGTLALSPPDDLRVQERLLEIIDEDFAVVEQAERYIVLARER